MLSHRNHGRSHPCPICGSTTFFRLHEAFVEVAVLGTSDPERNPRFTLLVCAGCGRSDWFTDPKAAVAYWRLRGGAVDRVDASTPPYR